MRWLGELQSRLGYLGRRRRFNRELDQEICFHIETRTDELVQNGLSRAAAESVARREFGSTLRTRERTEDAWQFRWLEDLLVDLRYALRAFRHSPAFTLTALVTLALGIGANTAVFSIVNAVVLQPLPYDRPDEIVTIAETSPQFDAMSVSYLNFVDWQSTNRSFRDMAITRSASHSMTGRGASERLTGRIVSAGFFRTLGIRPALGRVFLSDDDRRGATPTVVLSHGFWQRRLGSDPKAIGQAITLDGRQHTIIGVLTPGFWFYSDAEVFTSAGLVDDRSTRDRAIRSGFFAVARLRPGVSLSQAEGEMKTIAARLAAAYPDANAARSVVIHPILADVVGGAGITLSLLMGAVGFVLLIACANVANLLLARATSRQRELAVRAALGAGRGRVVRQLLTESVLLSVGGACAGLALASWGTRFLIRLLPAALPRSEHAGLDLRVLAFTFGVSIVTGLVFGLIPSLRLSRAAPPFMLHDRRRVGTGAKHRLQDLLVVSQLATTLLLLVCAGLVIQSARRLMAVDPGFDPRNILTFNVAVSRTQYETGAHVRQFYERLVRRLSGLPGVKVAALCTNLPMRDDSEIFFYVVDRPKPAEKDMSWAMFYPTTPGYRQAMGLTVLRGRFVTEEDTAHAAPVVVIDDVMARGLFPGEDPIGRRLVVPYPGIDEPREIVGIVKHVMHWGLADDARAKIRYQFYMPAWQIPDSFWSEAADGVAIVLRTGPEPSSLAAAAEQELHRLDPDQPVYRIATMSEIIGTSLAAQRFATWLLSFFAGMALLLAAVGIYGVTAYSVSQRTTEVGVRMALGAARRDVLQLVLTEAAMRALAGIVIGAAAALALTRWMTSLLFEVSPTDPVVFVVVSLTLMLVTLLACCVPALRAVRVDPSVALRAE